MENYCSPFIFAAIFIIVCVIERIFRFFDEKFFPYKKVRKSDIFKFKCKKLHDKIFNYYYDLMMDDPVRLAYDLASKDLNYLKRNSLVEKTYDNLRRA